MSLSGQLAAFGQSVPAHIQSAIEDVREEMHLEMAEDLEDKFVLEVFGQQKSPQGLPWAKLSEITKRLRAQGSIPAGKGGRGCKPAPARRYPGNQTKAGTGPTNTMIRSFQVGEPGNLYESREDGFTYGSKLKRGSHIVVEAFQKFFQFPNSPEKEGCIRAYLGRNTGIHAPARGKKLTHPARVVVAMPQAWLQDLWAIGATHMMRAVETAVRQSADAGLKGRRVAGTAAGSDQLGPGRFNPRRISEVG